MTFADFGVPSMLIDILEKQGITTPTPIQAATLPDSLAGRDVLGRGRTGSGKTYAFLLPLVARLDAAKLPAMPRKPRALILAPTRELVGQIHAALKPLADAAGLSTLVVYGGVSQGPQTTGLKKGVDIVVACPGRLEDLMQQSTPTCPPSRSPSSTRPTTWPTSASCPAFAGSWTRPRRQGQRLLFSATLDKAIDVLVKRFLTNPVTHEADSAQSPVSTMAHHVLHVNRDQRVPVLVDLTSAPGRTVVFTRTKHGAKALTRQLNKSGVPTVELHGNLSQNARTRNMEAFHSGKAATLVATDIAARGIHVDDVALVIHADPPAEHKAYLHRSGRTARAGAEGTVITLMTDEQVRDVRDLTRLAGIKPTTTKVHGPGHPMLVELAPGERSTPGGLVPTSPPPVAAPPTVPTPSASALVAPARPTASRVGATRRATPARRPAVRWRLHRRRPASSFRRRRPGCPGRWSDRRQPRSRSGAVAAATAARVPRPVVARTRRRTSPPAES